GTQLPAGRGTGRCGGRGGRPHPLSARSGATDPGGGGADRRGSRVALPERHGHSLRGDLPGAVAPPATGLLRDILPLLRASPYAETRRPALGLAFASFARLNRGGFAPGRH